MTLLTRQTLRVEITRFFTAIFGVAFSVFLIGLLLSFYQGWRVKVGRFVESVDADLWVARQGTSDFINSASFLPTDLAGPLSGISGVERVDPLIVRPMNFTVEGKEQATHLVGYDAEAGGAGGPSNLRRGRPIAAPGDLVVDEAFARKAGLRVGDELSVAGQTLRVVGISSGGDFIFSQTSFVDLQTARALTGMDEDYTFFLLRLSDRSAANDVSALAVAATTGVSVYTTEGFSAATRDRIVSNLLPIIAVIVFLAFVVGVALSGLTIYNTITEKSNEFGILKAVGFDNRYLYRLVLEQGLVVAAAGFALGSLIAVVVGLSLPSVVPQFPVVLRVQDFAIILVLTFFMGAISSLVPVRRIAAIDPVLVFRK